MQHHYVKPQPNELSESLLTDDCKTETGLDENAVKNGQSLDHVLEEVNTKQSLNHLNSTCLSTCLQTNAAYLHYLPVDYSSRVETGLADIIGVSQYS